VLFSDWFQLSIGTKPVGLGVNPEKSGMQSVCDLGRSLTAPSPLPVDFPIFAYFGLTGISHWKIDYFRGEKRKETM
jgi:hypothetical protein